VTAGGAAAATAIEKHKLIIIRPHTRYTYIHVIFVYIHAYIPYTKRP
jgi:hypothetical protein